MGFRGWSSAAVDFYDGLEEDNSKAFWLAHKAVYDNEVKAPMEALLAELTAEFGAWKLFRPNRDVRFSTDKSPYKTAIAGTLGPDGYIQLSAAGLAVGRGMYMMAPDQLARYRAAAASEAAGSQLAALVGAARRGGSEVVAHGSLKTAPRGYPKDHPRLDLLRLKGLVVWRQWPAGDWLARPDVRTAVADQLRAGSDISAWLVANVGAAADPARR